MIWLVKCHEQALYSCFPSAVELNPSTVYANERGFCGFTGWSCFRKRERDVGIALVEYLRRIFSTCALARLLEHRRLTTRIMLMSSEIRAVLLGEYRCIN